MQMWEALSSTEDENNSVRQPQEIDDSMVPSFTLLQWGTACAKKVPRYQHNFAEDTIQWYIKPRSSIHWWNHFVFYAHEDDERWRELFRLPYLLFEEVVQYVRDDLQQKNIPPQLAQLPGRLFSVEKKVGIAIMVLASSNSQYHIANLKQLILSLRSLQDWVSAHFWLFHAGTQSKRVTSVVRLV
ncbi:hypothetical protein L7F22_060962 [Adiantum nelumboides]|nr:hypothetical protein [Adiantum nelumboides]